jgi:hypothetical protein
LSGTCEFIESIPRFILQEQAERALEQRERQQSFQGSKGHYKKKVRPARARGRAQLLQPAGCPGASSSAGEVLSTSPEFSELQVSILQITYFQSNFPLVTSYVITSVDNTRGIYTIVSRDIERQATANRFASNLVERRLATSRGRVFIVCVNSPYM